MEGVGSAGAEPEKKGGTMVFSPETGKLDSHPFAQTSVYSLPEPPPSPPLPRLQSSETESVPKSKLSLPKLRQKGEDWKVIHIQKTIHITSDPDDTTPQGFLNTEVSSPSFPPRRFSTVSSLSDDNEESSPDPNPQMDSPNLRRIPSPDHHREYDIVRPGTSQSEMSTWTVETSRTNHTGSERGESRSGEGDREREVYLSKVRIARSGSFGVLGGRKYDVKNGGGGNEDSD